MVSILHYFIWVYYTISILHYFISFYIQILLDLAKPSGCYETSRA